MLAAENGSGENSKFIIFTSTVLWLAYLFTGVVSSKSASSARDLITSGLGESLATRSHLLILSKPSSNFYFLWELIS